MKNKTPLIIIVAAAAVAAVIIVVAAVVQSSNNADAHRPATVSFSFEIPDYDPATGSGIPLVIEGTDLDGNAVQKQALVDSTTCECQFLVGSYTARIAGSPVNAQGGTYRFQSTPIPFEIASPDDALDPITFKFTAVAPEEVTDDEIAAIKKWMGDFEIPTERIDQLVAAVTSARQAAQERIAEEQRQAAEAAAAAERAARIDHLTGAYSMIGVLAGGTTFRSMTIGTDELIIEGGLYDEHGTKMGDKR